MPPTDLLCGHHASLIPLPNNPPALDPLPTTIQSCTQCACSTHLPPPCPNHRQVPPTPSTHSISYLPLTSSPHHQIPLRDTQTNQPAPLCTARKTCLHAYDNKQKSYIYTKADTKTLSTKRRNHGNTNLHYILNHNNKHVLNCPGN